MQVFDEDAAKDAEELADKLEVAVSSKLVLPEKHGLKPHQNNFLPARN